MEAAVAPGRALVELVANGQLPVALAAETTVGRAQGRRLRKVRRARVKTRCDTVGGRLSTEN